MNRLKFYTSLYNKLRRRNYLPDRLLSPLRFVTRYLATKRIPAYLKKNRNGYLSCVNQSEIIVSLTSFPARIEYVWLAVESILHQTLSPRKVMLWLSSEQFPSIDSVPQSLKNIKDERFEIRLVPGDIRSHKKFYYAFQEYPDNIIVTIDDDSFYDPDMLLCLFDNHKKYPNRVIANCTKRITYTNGIINPYVKWVTEEIPFSDNNQVQIGFGGVLYPPHSLDKDVLKRDLFTSLCPLADDLWLNGMARKNRTKVMRSSFKAIVLPIMIKDDVELTTANVNESKNDKQLNALRQYYIQRDNIDLYEDNYSFND